MRLLIIILSVFLLPSMMLGQVRTEDVPVPLISLDTPVANAAEALSRAAGPSGELKSLEWVLDAADAAFTGTVKVYQSNDAAGPWVQWVSKMSGTSSPTITMTRKRKGDALLAPLSLSLKAGVNNGNGSSSTVKRLTALARKAAGNSVLVPVEVDLAQPIFKAGTEFLDGGAEVLSDPISQPAQLKSLDWDLGAAGATTNVTLTVYSSNTKDGPYLRWSPTGTTTQFTLDNKRQGTDIAWPDTAYCKVGVINNSGGGDLTTARMTALRRKQRSR